MSYRTAQIAAPMGIARILSGYGPKPMLDKPNEGGADDAAAKAAAEKAAAEKAAADKAAADKAAADAAAAAAAKELEDKLKGLSDREAELLKDAMKKKEKLQAAEKTLADLQAQLKRFEGIDPGKVAELLKKEADAEAAKVDAEKKALEAKGDFERLKQMMADEHAKQLKEKDEAVTTTKSALDAALAQIDELTIGNAFGTSSFITDELVLTASKARTLYGAHFELENGQIVAYDKPKGAKERTKLVDGSGNAVAFDEAIKKIVNADPDRDRLIKSKVGTGAHSRTSNDKTAPQNTGATGVSRMAAALAARAAARK